MRFVDSSSLVKFSCVALALLSPSRKIYADPIGSSSGSWPPTFSSLIADASSESDRVAPFRFNDPAVTEIRSMRNTAAEPAAVMPELLLPFSSGMNVLTTENAQAELGSSISDRLLAGSDTVPAPESSTLFLLGLGLVGLAHVPIQKLAKKLPNRRQQFTPVKDGITDLPMRETPRKASQNLRPTHEPHLKV